VERFAIGDSAFWGESYSAPLHALSRIDGTIGSSGLVSRIDVKVWHNAADSLSAPSQSASVLFEPHAAVSVVGAQDRMQIQTDSVLDGAMPFMPGFTLFLDLLRRRLTLARQRSSEQSVPILRLFTGGISEVVRGQWTTPRTLSMRVASTQFVIHHGDAEIDSIVASSLSAEGGLAPTLTRRIRQAGSACSDRPGKP
jgi:hypothetical protein